MWTASPHWLAEDCALLAGRLSSPSAGFGPILTLETDSACMIQGLSPHTGPQLDVALGPPGPGCGLQGRLTADLGRECPPR